MGRCTAVQRDADRAYAHPQARGDRRLRAEGAGSSASTSSVRSSTAASTSSTRSAISLSTSRSSSTTRCGGRTARSTSNTTSVRIGSTAPAAAVSSTRQSAGSPALPLDRSRPLWEMYFIEGLANGRIAVLGKIHHALADGVASANLLARGMDLQQSPRPIATPMPANPRPPRANSCGRRSSTTCGISAGCRE